MTAYKVKGCSSHFVCVAKTALHARQEGAREWGRGMTDEVVRATSDDCVEYQRLMGSLVIVEEDI